MTEEKIIDADKQPQDKFVDELLSDDELDNVAGGNVVVVNGYTGTSGK